MPVCAVLGAQWGDEGKGKIVDFLAQNADIIARFSGGNNAGHTVINDFGSDYQNKVSELQDNYLQHINKLK